MNPAGAVLWMAAGAAAALIVIAWRAPKRDSLISAAGYCDGQVDQLEELDRLIDLDPSVSVEAARRHLDALYVRTLVAKERQP